MRGVLLSALILALTVLAACGEQRDPRVRGDTLTVYVSVPRHGVSAVAGEAALIGARRALTDARGRAGGRRVRLVALSATEAADASWDPGAVKRAAERAAKDPKAIAYIGELDSGASAVSLPVTNSARLLQVSPTDGLTSLTRSPPGRPRAGPERLRPEGVSNFVRLVPSDLQVARTLVSQTRSRGVDRVAILHTDGVAERELGLVLARLARAREVDPVVVDVVRGDGEEAEAEAIARDVEASSADAVILAGVRGPATAAVLRALARKLPSAEVLCTGAMLRPATGAPARRCGVTVTSVAPARVRPAGARRLLNALTRDRKEPQPGGPVAAEALHAYEAMRLVLESIARGGPDREAVMAAALAPRERRSPLGRYTVSRTGDVAGLRVTSLPPPASRAGVRGIAPDPR